MFGQGDETERPTRPTKRRKLTKKVAASVNPKHAARSHFASEFVPLLNGAERPEFVSLRQKLFVDAWSAIDARIQVCLYPHRHPSRRVASEHESDFKPLRMFSGNQIAAHSVPSRRSCARRRRKIPLRSRRLSSSPAPTLRPRTSCSSSWPRTSGHLYKAELFGCGRPRRPT